MVLMTCNCLNIRIHGRSFVQTIQDTNYPYFNDKTAADLFFSPNTLLVTLDLAGVTKGQKALCRDRFLDGWSITSCSCCALEVYAQFREDHDQVLVSSNIEQNPERISALMDSPRYSRLFKLVLPEINDYFIQNNIGIELRNSNLDASVENVQNQVSNYLRDELKAMEERIRKFTEVQQSKYSDLLQRVRKHKQAMVYLLLKAKENVSNQNEVGGELPLMSPVEAVNKYTAYESSSSDSAFDRSEASDPFLDRSKKQNPRFLRRTMSNPVPSDKPKRELKRSPISIDVGGVFDMEEIDSKEEYSDEDSEGSESSSCILDSISDKHRDEMMCATSLPVSIPSFSHYPHYSNTEDADEEEFKIPIPKDPEAIAASMRALACSVRDGTEMFGELPRRRLNTGELLSSRPL